MAISKSRLEAFQDALEAVAQEACEEWRRFREVVSERYFAPEIIRDAAIDKIWSISAKYGDVSASIAAELFEELGRSEADKAFNALLADTYDQSKIEGSVRYAAHHLFDNDDAAFFDYLVGTVDKVVKQPARDTIMNNAARYKDKGVRFARIPRGPTCPFCLMLASRGFVYHSAQTAGEMRRFHPKCDCQVVPSWEDSPRVDGYDPEGAYDRYLRCREAIERIPGTASTKEILAEMRTRDRQWLYDGTPCRVTKEKGAKPLDKETAAAQLLAQNGFHVDFIKEINQFEVKTADARLNGVVWEFKIPEAWNEKTVKNQLKRALGKGTDKVLLDGGINGASLAAMEEAVLTLFKSGEFPDIRQVLVIDSGGAMKRISRE